ncbi:hypothetical protein AVEN_126420-1 [Araneus ventricosus]|uniref:DDE-1 domain-containing protein n=1 Tax=Araneus ventricosus TaxID=182803 RepID=A0A4Y2LLY8_ARAVE|nr:hypothetical protein AVEN_126415-1 [Araneus ventricosus]GBN14556.1 hypothetical protein AVEN_126420-1 [Araneus ventricosus]
MRLAFFKASFRARPYFLRVKYVVAGKFQKSGSLTLLLCCNMLGDFKTPVVTGNAEKPRCFKNIDVRKLSVSWKSNEKAWMSTEIMSDWLVELDNKMKKKEKNHSVRGQCYFPS